MKKVITVCFIVIIAFATGCAKQNAPADPSQMAPGITFPVKPMQILFDDCDDNDNVNAWAGYWFTYDDRAVPNNGVSVVFPRNGDTFTMSYVGPDYPGDNLYAARMWGQVIYPGSGFQYPLVGMGSGLHPMEIPQDLTNFDGIKFWTKMGAGDTVLSYRIALKSSNILDPGLQDYWGYIFAPNTSWAEVDVPFASLGVTFGTPEPLLDCLAVVQGIQIQTKNPNPTVGVPQTWDVDVWIDNIILYRN